MKRLNLSLEDWYKYHHPICYEVSPTPFSTIKSSDLNLITGIAYKKKPYKEFKESGRICVVKDKCLDH
jgi:hypothetical protein